MNYSEFKYHFFGLFIGWSNLRHNGFLIGIKKTMGKLLQPVNSYSRFPEYYYFENRIDQFISAHPGETLEILDIGSPKLFGLYLAFHKPVKIILTDYHEHHLQEYLHLWNSIKRSAKGQIEFSSMDARSLPYGNGAFDVVYSMSVIEHIEGHDGDSRAVEEICRVAKPAGLILLSVPFGDHYIEQFIESSQAYLTDNADERSPYAFFQRIYDRNHIREKVLARLSRNYEMQLVSRRGRPILRAYLRIPLWLRGILGGLNPFISRCVNWDNNDYETPPSQYDNVHRVYDIYSDLIVSCIRNGSPHE